MLWIAGFIRLIAGSSALVCKTCFSFDAVHRPDLRLNQILETAPFLVSFSTALMQAGVSSGNSWNNSSRSLDDGLTVSFVLKSSVGSCSIFPLSSVLHFWGNSCSVARRNSKPQHVNSYPSKGIKTQYYNQNHCIKNADFFDNCLSI